MLTATYSIVAITAEQEKTRSILYKLQQYVQTTWKGLQNIDFSFFGNAFDRLMQFDHQCRVRKIELYLIPALRSASREADALIAELDAISVKATSLLRSIGDRLNSVFDLGSHAAHELCHAMDSYCNHLFIRFDKEERELLPLARRLFTIDDWFSIAAQFLSEDGAAHGRKRRLAVTQSSVSQPAEPVADAR